MKNSYYENSQDYINRWILSYADFVTLLLALFVVMYSLSLMNIRNLKDFSSSVNKIFSPSSSQPIKKTYSPEELRERERLMQTFSSTSVKVNNIDILEDKNDTAEVSFKIKNMQFDLNKDVIEFRNIKQLIDNKVINKDGLVITQESRGLVIRLKNNLLFDPGSDIIKDKARITLDQLARVLKDVPNSIRIEGHTDNRPISTSRFPSNWELSTARSTNLIKYLVNKHKFNPTKLSAVGYGEYMPLVGSLNKSDQSINRRVDIVILSSSSKILDPNIN